MGIADAPEFDKADLAHVRWFISGGAPLPKHLIEVYRKRGVVLRQGYGLTEVGVNCFAMTDEEAWAKAGSIGKPLMFTEAKVVDETGQGLPPGDVGELCFRGPHVSAGYWKNPEATAETIRNGWLHTGDTALRDSDGCFSILGRSKEMFISGGENVYPAEIESVLLAHPGVLEAAVVAVSHETWGEVGRAFLVVGENYDEEDLKSFLSKRLARYKLPRSIVLLDKLPLTSNFANLIVSSRSVAGKPGDWWLDKSFGRVDISAAARVGENAVTIQASPFSIYHELESAYVLGDFSLQPRDSGFVIVPPQPLQMGQGVFGGICPDFAAKGMFCQAVAVCILP